ncbi:MAG: hypothetical protein GY851_19305 [bacterium]|nr:hypothetical protein [bacterium]
MSSTETLVLYSDTNVAGKHDASGAFAPEAEAFAKFHGVYRGNVIGMCLPRVRRSTRRARVYHALSEARNLRTVVFFGHGWPDGIQFGFLREDIPDLVDHLRVSCAPDVRVVLYACLAAENDKRDNHRGEPGPATDGGFCDLLRDEMVRQGLDGGWVDGHKTAGHTSFNPYLVRFYAEDVDDPEFGAVGGSWIVQPRSRLWRAWVNALRNKKVGLRYQFPVMEGHAIRRILRGVNHGD